MYQDSCYGVYDHHSVQYGVSTDLLRRGTRMLYNVVIDGVVIGTGFSFSEALYILLTSQTDN